MGRCDELLGWEDKDEGSESGVVFGASARNCGFGFEVLAMTRKVQKEESIDEPNKCLREDTVNKCYRPSVSEDYGEGASDKLRSTVKSARILWDGLL